MQRDTRCCVCLFCRITHAYPFPPSAHQQPLQVPPSQRHHGHSSIWIIAERTAHCAHSNQQHSPRDWTPMHTGPSRSLSSGGYPSSTVSSASASTDGFACPPPSPPFSKSHASRPSLSSARSMSYAPSPTSSAYPSPLPLSIVNPEIFGGILALDDGDSTKEFSRALVWAWCDQAESAVEEMRIELDRGNLAPVASVAKYLQGSSASLGLEKVSRTCHAIHLLHSPTRLTARRGSSFSSAESSEQTSSYAATTPSTSSSHAFNSLPPWKEEIYALAEILSSPSLEIQEPFDIDAFKHCRIAELVLCLEEDVTQASKWFFGFYTTA